ncbi:MAG: APC family permease [Halanaerobiales bacterium]|nr:APC family permease [Halanaerobiales bacterium]
MDNNKMGLNETWSMAVGGMIGGGIFSVLGVIIATAGNLAWLSFLIAGLIALATGISYSRLTNKFEEGGGAFTYIKDINHEGLAGGLSWLLIIGYILTLSVYAFTFGQYLEQLLNFGPWFPRLVSISIILIFMYFNLRGVSDASHLEVFIVWAKLAILIAIAGVGLSNFNLDMFNSPPMRSGGTFVNAIIGASTIFMAYEGFQLITYDYNEIKDPDNTIYKAEMLAVISVIIVYIIVTLGTINLVSYQTIIEEKEVVLAIAGKNILGTAGLIIASIAALFSTGSAINSTIFATSRLAIKVADDGELPSFLVHKNKAGIPDRSIYIIGGVGSLLAAFGNLSSLVEAASFIFLVTFAIVNFVAFKEIAKTKIISFLGGAGAALASVLLFIRFLQRDLKVILALSILLILATLGRKFIYSHNS